MQGTLRAAHLVVGAITVAAGGVAMLVLATPWRGRARSVP